MKRTSILLGLLCFGLACVAQAEEPIVIKFSHVVAADTPKGKAAEHFATLARERKAAANMRPCSRPVLIGPSPNAETRTPFQSQLRTL